MSHSETESLHFYKYLCQEIGSETVVKARRMTLISEDLRYSNNFFRRISSGSKGEGLDLKGSDFDIMVINPLYAVYESETDCIQNRRTVLIMDTEDTPPCFTYLRFRDNYATTPYRIKQNLQEHRGKILFSSELFRSEIQNNKPLYVEIPVRIHGPCISDFDDQVDYAFCLEADRWVSQAQPWITRSRLIWPTPELISKITACGVLFVPIGYKGSITENLQWRISFSVAEKILIFSFCHTQLLCYALLKILLKEIVDRHEDLKGLLCSYFLKTLMFWISEEALLWRPDNIIPCFMACLQRLIYCVEYSTLLHYFIPENNLFYLRFNSKNWITLINILKNAYQVGVQIFSSSQTLHNYKRFTCEITRPVCEINSIIKSITGLGDNLNSPILNILNIFDSLLHHCKTELSRCIFKKAIATAFQTILFPLPHINTTNNKNQYKNYKWELSQLFVGLHSDSVPGWLKLASFFYVNKNYVISIDIINYTLRKCTDDLLSKITLENTRKLKLFSLLKTFPSPYVTIDRLGSNSSGMPKELQSGNTMMGLNMGIVHNSISFAHFLNFLCCYHLHDFRSCRGSLNKLLETEGILNLVMYCNHLVSLGIAFQMLGERETARRYFYLAAQIDKYHFTSASFRLD